MTDMLYEKQGSYLQGGEDKANEIAIAMFAEGDSVDKIVRVTKLSKEKVLKLKTQASKNLAPV